MFTEPDNSYHGLVYVDWFGPAAFIARARSAYQRTTGAVLAPMSAFLILQGIETVALRMARHVENARAVASFLRADPRVAWVDYVGFPDSPYHGLARKYLGGRAPSLFTFGVVGGLESAEAFYDALKLVKRVVNIGDTRSLCCHPASTTHRQMTLEEQLRAGVRAETIVMRAVNTVDARHSCHVAVRNASAKLSVAVQGPKFGPGSAATTVRHVSIAAARSARCVWAEVRWRWTLKVS